MEEQTIELRAHHFYWIAKYHKSEDFRKGQPIFGPQSYGWDSYTKMNELAEQIDRTPTMKVRLVRGADSICKLCSLLDGSTQQCKNENMEVKNPTQKDDDILHEKGLNVGETYTVQQIWDMFDINPNQL